VSRKATSAQIINRPRQAEVELAEGDVSSPPVPVNSLAAAKVAGVPSAMRSIAPARLNGGNMRNWRGEPQNQFAEALDKQA